jgi:hypothetical protein
LWLSGGSRKVKTIGSSSYGHKKIHVFKMYETHGC